MLLPKKSSSSTPSLRKRFSKNKGTKLSKDSKKYGVENTCTSGSTLSKAALSFARACVQMEKERGNLLKALGTKSGYGDGGAMYVLQPPGARPVAFPQMGNATAIAAAFGGGLPPGISGTNDRFLMLCNIPWEIDEDKLFNLFSLYGNIVRIKLLHSKPDHALVQMGDGFQAELAVHFLKF